MTMQFDEKTIQQLRYYVYLLVDPITRAPFYVGKGKGNRVFQHLQCALEEETSNHKYDKIRCLTNSGHQVEHVILRHGLKEEEAFLLESTLIDALNYMESGLTNITGGHQALHKGLMTADEVKRLYNAPPLDAIGPDCMVININRKYKRGSGKESIYQATKETWTINKDRLPGIRYVLSEYGGLIVEVFAVDQWYPKIRGYNPGAKRFGESRIGYGFHGHVAPEEIRQRYLNKSIAHKKKKGAASPIRFSL